VLFVAYVADNSSSSNYNNDNNDDDEQKAYVVPSVVEPFISLLRLP